MKKILLSAAAIMAFAFTAQAQSEEMKFGVKGGLSFSSFTYGDGYANEADGTTGFYIGGLVDLPVSGNFHIQPELLYSSEGADEAKISYIRVPVMAKYYIIEGLSAQAGPLLGFKVSADDIVDDATKSFDFGIGAGAGYELPMGVFFDIRYNVGLSNVSDADGGDIKNAGIQLGAGYRF